MIDKLDLRIPRKAPFTPAFQRLYPELQALDRGPFRAAKLYEYSGDLREYGFSVRLNLYCRMNQAGDHRLDLIDVGRMGKTEIVREITQIFEIDPLALGLMRLDLAVDVDNVPLQWFRETVRVQHKRYRAAISGQPFYGEMGNGDIETLYFGKRPNVIRIYDKRAEYDAQFRSAIRKLPRGELPSFESIMGFVKPESNLTRVERQFGGRMPIELTTFRSICATDFEYRPFAKLKIIDHAPLPERDSNTSFETYCTGRLLYSIAVNDGMQAVNSFITQHSNGNAAWARKKYARYLPASAPGFGLSEEELQARFVKSLSQQMGR